ncbi:MAG: fimbria major subunit [Muribaculaceae bacterium]|nr:fimbria major subunit [Muribaculaceae bacterium]
MKTTNLLHTFRLLILPSMMMAMGACSDSLPVPEENDATREGEITIVLRVPMADSETITRANPIGGEDGNGREKGLQNENRVFDANIFFFKGSGLNPVENPEVRNVYVSNLDRLATLEEDLPFEKKLTIKIKTADTDLGNQGILSATDVSFITVLNAGRDISAGINNLDDLRSYFNLSAAWVSAGNADASNCEKFIMTTAYDANSNGKILIDGVARSVGSNRLVMNTKPDALPGNPWAGKKWIGETTVQRMCARIDLMYKAENFAKDELLYNVPSSGNKVHITNILPVNVMQKTSYLLTKVTGAIPASWNESGLGKITWGGAEQVDATTLIPSNYVIEPRTLSKPGTASVPAEWYGSTAVATVKNDISNAAKGVFAGYFSTALPAPETDFDNCDRMTIISYANENIQSPDCYNSKFITGIALRGVYQPTVWSNWNNDTKELTKATKSDADWKAMADKTFWRYIPSTGVNDSNRDSEALYFASESEASQYSSAHPQDNASITKFDGGACYYNLWLRHFNLDNADPQQDYPMEYAIVRNNIYRVAISFSGPGHPTPTMREPDTMTSRIFVRKWNKREEKNPLTF